uniref:BED-type domain-containing protein n=1 Tax=Arundo donax TaxID=35708 RepID=A0A0A9E135_ARUDO
MEVEEEAEQRSQVLVKQKKPLAKKFMSPEVTMTVKSSGIRLMLSPRLKSPSTATTRTSPAPTPLPSSPNNKRPSSTRPYHKNKRRKLKSEIWTEFEPIYDGQILVQAQCIHCKRIFKVSQLANDTVEALICLQDWLRVNDSTIDDIAGNVIGDDDDDDDDDM